MALIPYYEVDFKPNSTHKTGSWGWGLHPLIYYERLSSLVDVGSPTMNMVILERFYTDCLKSKDHR